MSHLLGTRLIAFHPSSDSFVNTIRTYVGVQSLHGTRYCCPTKDTILNACLAVAASPGAKTHYINPYPTNAENMVSS
jgi:hypothetical protein